MASYEELVKKYGKRRKETLVNTVMAGLSYTDQVAWRTKPSWTR